MCRVYVFLQLFASKSLVVNKLLPTWALYTNIHFVPLLLNYFYFDRHTSRILPIDGTRAESLPSVRFSFLIVFVFCGMRITHSYLEVTLA